MLDVLEQSVDLRAPTATEPTSPPAITEEPEVAIDTAARRRPVSGRLARLLRRGGAAGWDPDEVAEHLMARETRIVRGLAQSTPWVGIDDDTLGSYYGFAAAIIARVAETGAREDWRTLDDLERAQVSAFRNQAFDHWKHRNATVRTADKHAVTFDPQRHDPGEAVFDRLFAQPDLVTVRRDLLAELTDPTLRSFWTLVFSEQITYAFRVVTRAGGAWPFLPATSKTVKVRVN